MMIIKTIPLLRKHIHLIRKEGKRIALVPTMGNLHDGHMKLINEAKLYTEIVVVSIFVNPMQFDCNDDLKNYPRTLEKDYEKLHKYHVDFVFVPSVKDMFPKGIKETTYVYVPNISTILEGYNRPNHFLGVSTIISKLFNLIQPDVAFFGEKDYQQLVLIRKMVVDMCYDIDVVSIPTVRAEDGLALSSRNNHLTSEQRKISPLLNKMINKMAENISSGKLNVEEIIDLSKKKLKNQGFRESSIYICDADTLLELKNNSKRAVILITAWLDQVRLIDNKIILLR